MQGDREVRHAIAQVSGVHDRTVKAWARGTAQDQLPGFFTGIWTISSIGGWYRFRSVLEEDHDALEDALGRAQTALECAVRLSVNYPPSSECEAAQDRLRRIRRAAEDLDEMLTEIRRARNRGVVELPGLERRA